MISEFISIDEDSTSTYIYGQSIPIHLPSGAVEDGDTGTTRVTMTGLESSAPCILLKADCASIRLFTRSNT